MEVTLLHRAALDCGCIYATILNPIIFSISPHINLYEPCMYNPPYLSSFIYIYIYVYICTKFRPVQETGTYVWQRHTDVSASVSAADCREPAADSAVATQLGAPYWGLGFKF